MESQFGPPSEPVEVLEFVRSAADLHGNLDSIQVPAENVIGECSVSDIRDSLSNAWNNPLISAHLLKRHEQTIVSLFSLSKPLKLKRRALISESDALAPEVAALQDDLDKVELGSWKLKDDSVLFMRSSKNAEQNAFAEITSGPDPLNPSDKKAIITVTLYDRLSWTAGSVIRASQHALLSSQTLGHIFNLLSCPPNGPAVDRINGEDRSQTTIDAEGGIVCIDGVAYGDISQAEKLLRHLETISKDSFPFTRATTSIHQTPLSDISLRVNQPYWLLHHGSCEHFIVVDQIRLQHPADVPHGYPLTLQVTPPLLDLCRACSKVPAVVSVIGDVRLGESPCMMCRPCWRNMGVSQGTNPIVTPLPQYAFRSR